MTSTVHWDLDIYALSSISHKDDSTSTTTALFRREEVIQPDGTGNSFRSSPATPSAEHCDASVRNSSAMCSTTRAHCRCRRPHPPQRRSPTKNQGRTPLRKQTRACTKSHPPDRRLRR